MLQRFLFQMIPCSFTAELKVETNVMLNCACYVYFQVAYVIYL